MSLVDENAPPEEQIARQAKIIDALMRRANRSNDVGVSAYSAFQSAIELQAQVAAKTRDLERAATELESVRYDRERARRTLEDALSAMGEGFALFTGGRLDICNVLFRTFLPDVAFRVRKGLRLEDYLDYMMHSRALVSTDRGITRNFAPEDRGGTGASVRSVVIELRGDRWYQLSQQRTSSSNVVLLLTEITSIVRQSRSEKELLIDRQAAYIQAAFEDMTSGVCTFSSSGEVMMYNRQFRQLLGLPFTLLQKGTTLTRLLDFLRNNSLVAEDADLRVEAWRRHLQHEGWLRKRIRHGTDRVLELQVNRLPDDGFLVELNDVTLESRATEILENRVQERTAELTEANRRLTEQYEEKARVEEELRLAKERAEAAVSSKTRFLAAASHDLLQPVNAAKLLLATLKERTRGTEFAATVERLYGAFGSTEQLLHSLLDISRLESADPSAVSPSEISLGGLMQGIYEDQSALAEQKNVRLSVVPSDVLVCSDPVYLLRSIQNLVVNAIQYTEPGGRVLVGCRHRGKKVILQVWDTGIGIGLKDQKRIFEEFARAENVALASGVGLGLSVVDRACKLLGHRLWVRSKPGVGSLFCIELDRVPGRRVPVEAPAVAPADTDLELERIILVIENDPDVLFAMTQKLEHWGASVLAAPSTAEALMHVRDMGLAPDIVLADYQLDGDDTGVRAIAEIRRETGVHVPAIVITADRREQIRRLGAEQGFTVMHKPVQLSKLRPLIEWKIRWQSPEPDTTRDQAQTKVGHDSEAQGNTLGAGRHVT
ncbi:PAS-domain containing protein [uncultured Mameliella sp.]|jgi:signal transduction histidine kinase/CheY-like chemotaxis protein|uniref:ATP-binding response regulator n=1 Tax=uncultured Mameliella sp. TaxID=1447087 RepID=UPI002624BADC|nr:PAS-domain containing protein [uncultured Mameliella sp.]